MKTFWIAATLALAGYIVGSKAKPASSRYVVRSRRRFRMGRRYREKVMRQVMEEIARGEATLASFTQEAQPAAPSSTAGDDRTQAPLETSGEVANT